MFPVLHVASSGEGINLPVEFSLVHPESVLACSFWGGKGINDTINLTSEVIGPHDESVVIGFLILVNNYC